MREDMFKVIVERPRGGKGWAHSSRKRLNRDGDLPTKIGVKRHVLITRAKSKWLSENLTPLKRYLGKQVGRPWSDVHSEIVATLRSRDPVQQHILRHLDDFVARQIVIDRNGKWIDASRHNGLSQNPPWRQRYYVDPTDGILKDSEQRWKALGIDPKPWKKKPSRDPNIRVLEEMREFRRIDGIWYEVLFHRDAEALAWVYDLIQRALVPARSRHAVAKRQLSRGELMAFGLTNCNN
ncbi:MAG TPA: hypothetical protein VIM02_15535 [Rhizomicrobium sp.]|jgi:hypothetical protein